MKVVIAVATADADLRAYLAANRDKVVPLDIKGGAYLRNKGARFSVHLRAIDQKARADDLGLWLRRLAKEVDGLILLIDEDLRHLARDFEDAYFAVSLAPYYGQNFQNQIRAALAPTLRHFVAYSQRFDNLRNLRVLLLPLDIFVAGDLAALRERMTIGKMEAGLGEDLDRLISAVNKLTCSPGKSSILG